MRVFYLVAVFMLVLCRSEAATVAKPVAVPLEASAQTDVLILQFLHLSQVAMRFSDAPASVSRSIFPQTGHSDKTPVLEPLFWSISDHKTRLLLHFEKERSSAQADRMTIYGPEKPRPPHLIVTITLPPTVVSLLALTLWPVLCAPGLYPRSPRQYRRM